MNEGQRKTITIKSIAGEPWNKPDTQQFWYSVVIEEFPSEPIKFVQNRDKGAPAPEVGKQYEGKAYSNEKGVVFYPSTPRPQRSSGYQRDDKEIRALAIMKSAADYTAQRGMDPEDIPTVAGVLYEVVEALKSGDISKVAVQDDKATAQAAEAVLSSVTPIDPKDIPF